MTDTAAHAVSAHRGAGEVREVGRLGPAPATAGPDGVPASAWPAPAAELDRHPLDPDPARSTKAAAVLALGVAAVVTGPVVGGIVPATVGLVLAKQARNDLIGSKGYLTGARHLRVGLTLAWVGIALAATALVIASVLGIISLANDVGQDFPDTSN